MAEAIEKSRLWSEAALSGLVLGVIPIVCTLPGTLLGNGDGAAAAMGMTALSMILWVVKVFGCMYAMAYFMKRLCTKYSGVDNQTTFRFGVITALLSALIVAGYSLLNMTLHPEKVTDALEMIESVYGSLMDSNTREAMEGMSGDLPRISFFTNLLYCFLYGTVLSSILSRSIPKKDIFSQDDKE